MDAPELPKVLPTLEYADPPAMWGISVQREPDGLRVIVPPARLRKLQLSGIYLLGVIFFGGASIMIVTAVIAAPSADRYQLIPALLSNVGLAFFTFARTAWRFRWQVIIDVTRDELAIESFNPWGGSQRATWRKREIGDVKFNGLAGAGGTLLIRITGRDMVEYPICPDREVTQWLAGLLHSGVFHESFTTDPQVSHPATGDRT